MKKSLLYSILLVLIACFIFSGEVQSENTLQTIPDEAIRLRILANSDTAEDQRIKRLVRDEVNAYITRLVQDISDIEKGREVIAASIPEIERIIQAVLLDTASDDAFQVEYRRNVAFPLKVYDDFVYPAGEYEAVLITLGKGMGANWWCVLFPPLCFLDFSNGTTIADMPDDDEEEVAEEAVEEEEDVEVTFFLLKWFGL